MNKEFVEGKNYYFAIPLVELNIESNLLLDCKKYYGYCSIYFPLSLQHEDRDPFALITIFNYFTTYLELNLNEIKSKELLFGESLFLPFIPNRGEHKWIQLGEDKVSIRNANDLPDYKVSVINYNFDFKIRKFWILKNAGISHEWNRFPIDFSESDKLEFGEMISEGTLKERIYFFLFVLSNLEIKKKMPDVEEIKKFLFRQLRKESCLNRVKDAEIIDEIKNFMNLFGENYMDKFIKNPKKLLFKSE